MFFAHRRFTTSQRRWTYISEALIAFGRRRAGPLKEAGGAGAEEQYANPPGFAEPTGDVVRLGGLNSGSRLCVPMIRLHDGEAC